jgi:hypothetical protein
MKKLVMAMFLIAQVSVAQVTKNIGDFDEVKVFDRINLELIPSSENKIEITGKRSNDVEVVNKNGEVKIRMKLEKLLKGEDVTAKLYFSELKSIDASEGSYIICDAIFKQTSLDITAREGAEIRLKLDLQKANIKAVTGGIIKVTGNATNQDAKIGTGGILEADNLETAQTSVTITTGGEADVRATDLVDAKVRAGGTITVFGSPKQINKKTTLGGTITESKR